jgi:amino acid transporter
MSGIVATVAMVFAILLSEFASGGSIAALFSVVLGFTISTTTLSYLFIFPTFLILRYKYPNVPRTYRVPGGMVGAWIVTLLPLVYAVIASWFILIPLSTPSSMTRVSYEVTQFAALAVIFLLTVVFYVWGHAEKRNKDVIVDLSTGAEGMTELGGAAGGGE